MGGHEHGDGEEHLRHNDGAVEFKNDVVGITAVANGRNKNSKGMDHFRT